MPSTIKIPLLGNVPKGAAVAGMVAAVGVGGYLLWRHNQQSKAAASGDGTTGYGATGYGYGTGTSGYYGYGYAYGGQGGYGNVGGGGVTPYPTGSQYGYGAFGYGYYNPYTGQFLGPPPSPSPTPTPTPTPVPVPTPNKTHTITANGHQTLWRIAHDNHIGELHLLSLNPQLRHLYGTKKNVPVGTRVKV